MQFLHVYLEGQFAPVDDVGHHAEEIAVVDLPDLLHQQISDPVAVLAFLQFSVAHDPPFVGLHA